MISAPRPAAHQKLPPWLQEGARVFDPGREREAIVQFIGDYEDPATRRFMKNAVFLRPEGGGREWIVAPEALRPADAR
ncbi:hypothetical protein OOK31_13225 [Streptomyces sp. NBC_00249]|uniref:hypothetical protein n=1 Tax=Streptomyces sp. NBC_00249 TaxID=2975690 RepID=UPI00224D1D87|nr:hypothetical protein [Streptomyces sp. NBC_00249]MCX5194849.1 hypothetical protein [Streptomyces sp. NBC_00249]